MAKIFISYRHDDSTGYAGRVSDCLAEAFGAASVFLDVYSLEPGEDFAHAIRRKLSGCDVLLAIIGRRWLSSGDAANRPRLENADDFVRLEIETALARKIPIIPVLVDRATMPDERQLPESIRALARYQGIELSDSRWTFDISKLVDHLRRQGGLSGPEKSIRPTRSRVHRWAVFAALCALGAASVGVYAWLEITRRGTPEARTTVVKAAERGPEQGEGVTQSNPPGTGRATAGGLAADRSGVVLQSTGGADGRNSLNGSDGKMPGRAENIRHLAPEIANSRPQGAAPPAGAGASAPRQANGATELADTGAALSNAGPRADAGTPHHQGDIPAGVPQGPSVPPVGPTPAEIAVARGPLIAELNALRLRRDVIAPSLASLRESQRARGYALRGDMANAELLMNQQISAAEADVDRPNMDREVVLSALRAAHDAIETLEGFLNIPQRRKP
jgi:hypothetical protein